MGREHDQTLQARDLLKKQFGWLFDEVEQILFTHDPIGIAFKDHEFIADNPDEYAPEVETILPRLKDASDVGDAISIVFEEFVNWFDKEDVGKREKYEPIAADIWKAWQTYIAE